MSGWQFRLDLTDIWEKASKETEETWMIPKWFVEELLKRLHALEEEVCKSKDPRIRNNTQELSTIISDIDCLQSEEGIPKEDFDLLWEKLYDWADTSLVREKFGGKTMCWIATRM